MKNKLIIILCCVFNFILCSFPTDEDDYSGPMEYDSFLANISINGKNDQKITYYSSNSRAVSAKMYWLGEKPLFLLYRDDLYIYNMNGEIINSIKKPANILDMDVNYDGSYAVFACNGDSAELYLFNISLLEIKKITNSPQMMERYPHFSQDGQKIVYTVQTGNAATDPYALKLYDLVADSSYTLLFSDSGEHAC